jgi:hypothetical protein
MIFSSSKYRCARCRHRLQDGQIECEHCAWEVDTPSAREMGRMVANFRRYYFWRRVKDVMLGKHSVISQNSSSQRRSASGFRDVKSISDSAIARAPESSGRVWLGMKLTTALLLNLTASVLLAANLLDQSLLPRIASDDMAPQDNIVSIQYGWPFAALTTRREFIQRASPGETLIPEWKREWNYARIALNVLVGAVLLTLVRFFGERVLMRQAAPSKR